MNPSECPLCALVAERDSPRLIHNFGPCALYVGEHRFFDGYCVLVAKEHVRELHHLPGLDFYQALNESCRAIEAAYRPAKLNLASYGNMVPHVHIHIFPRYPDDPDALRHPWVHMDRFPDFGHSAESLAETVARLRAAL